MGQHDLRHSDEQIFDVFVKSNCGPGNNILLVDGKPHEVYLDDHGTLRFRGNPIVSRLLDKATGDGPPWRGVYDMNQIVVDYQLDHYTKAQLREFYILIGYSLSGFLELQANHDVELRLP